MAHAAWQYRLLQRSRSARSLWMGCRAGGSSDARFHQISSPYFRPKRHHVRIWLGELPDARSRDPEEMYKSWVTVNWTLWNSIGGVVKGPFTFGTGDKEIICMSSFPNTASSYGMASCLLFHRTWMAQFIGNGKDVDTFFGVVRGASIVVGSSVGKR